MCACGYVNPCVLQDNVNFLMTDINYFDNLAILSFVCFSTGQAPVVLRRSQGDQQDIPIVVNEGNNVTFQCDLSGAITVAVRPPGESDFVTNLPVNVMRDGVDDSVTITVVNAQRDENTLAFLCGAGGILTDIGILTVYCKFCH